MANTVNSLNYANTFSDWVNVTNLTTIELNSLGKGTYTKDSGTLILNGAEALRANGPVNIYNSKLSVIGGGSSATIQYDLTVGGNTALNGSVVYSQNTLTLSAAAPSAQLSYINVNRGSSGANASIRWNETNKYWDMYDITSANYYKVLTSNNLTDSVSTVSSAFAASATAVNTAYSAATSALSAITIIQGVDAAQNTSIQAAFNKANTGSGTFNGTTGQAISNNGVITYASANGVTVTGSSNTLTISTPQDLRTTASPSFSGLTTSGTTSLYGAGVVRGVNIGTNEISLQNATTGMYLNLSDTSGNNGVNYSYTIRGLASAGATGVNLTAFNVNATTSAFAGSITSTGNITAYYSDERLKNKLGNIENALAKVNALSGFYYEANQTAQDLGYKPVREVGVSAQEVQAILPEIVAPAPIDNQYLTVHYERLVPLLIEAIKELSREIEELKKK